MADFAAQINEARQNGHTDDEILGYLSSRPELGPKIKEAQGSGYGAADILGHLSKSVQASPPPQQTFGQQFAQTVKGLPTGIWNTITHPSSLLPETYNSPGQNAQNRQEGSDFSRQTIASPPGFPATAGHMAGMATNDAIMGATGAALGEVPYGRIATGIRAAAPDVAAGTGKLAAGGVAAHMLPHEAQIALGYPLYQGAKQVGQGLAKGYRAFKGISEIPIAPPPLGMPSVGLGLEGAEEAPSVPFSFRADRHAGMGTPAPAGKKFIPSDLMPKPVPPASTGDGFQLTNPPLNFAQTGEEATGSSLVPHPLTRHDLELLGQQTLDLRAGGGGVAPTEWQPATPRQPGSVGFLPPRPPAPPPVPFVAPPYEPSGSMGRGPQAGFSASPLISKPPVEMGGAHVPDYQHPGLSPAEMQAKIAADKAAALKEAGKGPAVSSTTAVTSAPGAAGEGQIPVRQHETNLKVDQQIENKINNLAQYLRSKGGTPEHLDQIVADPALTRQYLNEAHSYGKSQGNPVPKTQYKGLDPGSDSHLAVRQRILDLIEKEKNPQ